MKTESNTKAESPIVWFAVLLAARDKGDYDRAADALAKLKALGIDVRFRRPPSAKGGPA